MSADRQLQGSLAPHRDGDLHGPSPSGCKLKASPGLICYDITWSISGHVSVQAVLDYTRVDMGTVYVPHGVCVAEGTGLTTSTAVALFLES